MQYHPYGKDGPRISRLGFGVMRLPTRPEGNYAKPNYTRSAALMRAALKAGVNFFDSHHRYHGGNSEVAIGKALRGWKGHRVFIQTKTPWYNDEPEEYFERMLDEALEKLGVDCIDYLLHHSMQMDTWKKRGRKFLKFTDKAMDHGLIRHRGFSSHDTPENIRKFIDTGEFAAMLVSYNWMNPQMRDTIACASDKGMGVTVMNPVGGGALATSTPQVVRLLRGAGSAPEVAMRYVLATPGVTCALSGMNTLEQVEENARIASRRQYMTRKQQTAMHERLEKIRAASSKFCTACGYCMPCPHGVDIPGAFRLLNQVKFFGQEDWARKQYVRLKKHPDGDRSSTACVRCGSCEPKCPIKVPIPDQLEAVERLLG